ncbi:hypothetical protein [Aeromonas sp. 102P]|uniref:hypothetical protein n=1 Tax=Aeromonas sp. 102P TaxID=3452711 RepID=UPI003F79B1A7|nr:hypothetical protein [Aeromonas veronii]
MKLCRIIARYKDDQGSTDASEAIVLQCGLDETGHIMTKREWMGYVRSGDVYWPLILRRDGSEFFYGGEEHSAEETNIFSKKIEENTYFTLHGYVYVIVKIEPLGDLPQR